MRSFIAIEMVPEGIEAVYDEIRGSGADIRFVSPKNLHLTLKFLGEVEEGRIEEIYAAMKKSFEGIAPFKVAFRGVGVFPGLSYVRVVWVGIEDGREPLTEMQKRLEGSLAPLGFKKEKRFEPHLTIGRARSARNREKLVSALNRLKDVQLGELQVGRVELKKSVLTPSGPIYTTLREVVL